jgi:hypothetical protein
VGPRAGLDGIKYGFDKKGNSTQTWNIAKIITFSKKDGLSP